MKPLKHLILLAFISCLSIGNTVGQKNSSCLIGHYMMNGNAKDSSISANHCTISGATLTADRFGKSNSAYYFNGSASLYAPLDTRGFEGQTVTAWIKTNYTGQQSTIVQTTGAVLYTNRYGQGKFLATFNGSSQDNSSSDEATTDVANGEWFFVAAVCDGRTTKLYINDSLENSYSESLYNANSQLTIGLQINNMWGFTGSIDEVRVYKCALSSSEIKDIYNSENIVPTGMNETNLQKQKNVFSIYPSPSGGKINISLENIAEQSSLTITDITGKILHNININPSVKNNVSLDLSNHPAGIYFAKLATTNTITTQKFILK